MRRIALAVGAVVVAAALVATAVTFASSGGTTVDHDGDALTLAAGPDQSITGETDREPGTTLDVRLASTDASNPFLQSREATVAENGSFATTVDLGAVAEGATANLTVRDGDDVLTAVPVEIVACAGACEEPNATDEGQSASEEGQSASEEGQSGTTIERGGETLVRTAGQDREISGESDQAAGTELVLTVESTDATDPFLSRETVTVQENGSFAATMDFDAVTEPMNATVAVERDDEELARTDLRVVPCEGDCDERQSSTAGESTPPDEFGLEEGVVVSNANETAEIPVAVGDAEAATLRVGDDDVNYQVTATGRDANGDGRVVFVFDPAAAGSDDPTVTVRDGDDDHVSVVNESAVDGPLSPADYDLTLFRGPSADDGDVDDIGVLSLQRS